MLFHDCKIGSCCCLTAEKNCKADNPFFSICNNRFLHGSQISNVENENLAAALPFFAHFWQCIVCCGGISKRYQLDNC